MSDVWNHNIHLNFEYHGICEKLIPKVENEFRMKSKIKVHTFFEAQYTI